MDNLESIIATAKDSLLILLPQDPQLDEVAAGLALYLSLKNKKEVAIICLTPMTVGYGRLIGVDKISTSVGSKNLVIKFKGYNPNNVDKVNYDIKDGEFFLTITPKNGIEAPKRESINISHLGLSSDLIILVGGKSEAQFPTVFEGKPKDTKLVHVGNSDLGVRSENVPIKLARPGISVCESVAELIKESGYAIDADIATNLLAGILSSGQNLMSTEITADTFQLIADLLRAGGRRVPLTNFNKEFPSGAVSGQFPAGPVQQPEDVNPPKDWYQTPKIYKGTSVS